MTDEEALTLACAITLDWAGEHGFGDTEAALRCIDAVERLHPEMHRIYMDRGDYWKLAED